MLPVIANMLIANDIGVLAITGSFFLVKVKVGGIYCRHGDSFCDNYLTLYVAFISCQTDMYRPP